MPKMVSDKVLAWGHEIIEPNTIEQASMISKMPFVAGHVALMPDAHLGKGSSVGTVIPTSGAIIPAAIGVDIGDVMACQSDLVRVDDILIQVFNYKGA